MISATDAVVLAPGVAVRREQLSDAVRGHAWPLNASGAFVLARTGRPLGVVARELAEAFSLPVADARSDVLRFVWQLNRLALVNVERTSTRLRQLVDWLRLAARLAPAGAFPAPITRRRALDTRTVTRAIVSSFVAVAPRAMAIAAVAAVLTGQIALLLGAGLVGPLVIGLGTGIGLGLHEAVHAALLRGVPSALVLHGQRTYVLHARIAPLRRALVAVGGPLVVAALGLALVVVGILATSPTLAIAGCPFAAHALALTVVGGDGRVACGL